MYTRKQLYIFIIIGVIIIVGALLWLFRSPGETNLASEDIQMRGIPGESIDVALDFFEAWSEARLSTTTDPYQAQLVERQEVGVSLKKKLLESETQFRETSFDPVLCQNEVPGKFRAKSVYENEQGAQILIMPKEKEGGIQSIVTISKHDGLTEIVDISCSAGEQALVQGEYHFDTVGFLLKQSVQPPLDPQYWHLVFAQGGVLGYTVPLFFSEISMCAIDGVEQSCNDGLLMETMKVQIQGSMTEAGVEVSRLTLVNE
jgi:hypothetical protein